MQKKCQIDNWLARNARNANQIVACYLADNKRQADARAAAVGCLGALATRGMLSTLPDELIQLILAELGAILCSVLFLYF